MRDRWLMITRYGWLVAAVGLVAGRDACLGGGKRPDPQPAPTSTSAPPGPTFATPPPPQPPG